MLRQPPHNCLRQTRPHTENLSIVLGCHHSAHPRGRSRRRHFLAVCIPIPAATTKFAAQLLISQSPCEPSCEYCSSSRQRIRLVVLVVVAVVFCALIRLPVERLALRQFGSYSTLLPLHMARPAMFPARPPALHSCVHISVSDNVLAMPLPLAEFPACP